MNLKTSSTKCRPLCAGHNVTHLVALLNISNSTGRLTCEDIILIRPELCISSVATWHSFLTLCNMNPYVYIQRMNSYIWFILVLNFCIRIHVLKFMSSIFCSSVECNDMYYLVNMQFIISVIVTMASLSFVYCMMSLLNWRKIVYQSENNHTSNINYPFILLYETIAGQYGILYIYTYIYIYICITIGNARYAWPERREDDVGP